MTREEAYAYLLLEKKRNPAINVRELAKLTGYSHVTMAQWIKDPPNWAKGIAPTESKTHVSVHQSALNDEVQRAGSVPTSELPPSVAKLVGELEREIQPRLWSLFLTMFEQLASMRGSIGGYKNLEGKIVTTEFDNSWDRYRARSEYVKLTHATIDLCVRHGCLGVGRFVRDYMTLERDDDKLLVEFFETMNELHPPERTDA